MAALQSSQSEGQPLPSDCERYVQCCTTGIVSNSDGRCSTYVYKIADSPGVANSRLS